MQNTDFTGQLLDGKYLLIKKLGEGGMGAVYLGKHATMGKMVAVKILHSILVSNEELVRRFIREAQATVSINHKNIIDIMDLGALPTGEPFIVMEYLQGAGLDEIIRVQKQLDLPTAAAILEPTLRAIGAAHDKGVVHRDLKPENIYINHPSSEDLDIKLIDFGISKIQNNTVTKLTQEGTTLGTPAYMSPEQARGAKEMNHLTDIYATGIIFFEMLSGETPFEGDQYNVLLANILTADPRHPQSVYPNFPMDAWPVIQKAISKNPSERYQNTDEMISAINALCTQEERDAKFAALPDSIEKANSQKQTPPEDEMAHNTMAASQILSELVQQNTAVASATILDPKTNSHSQKNIANRGATLLSQVLSKTIMQLRSVPKTWPGKIARGIKKARYGLFDSPKKTYFRMGVGGGLLSLFLLIGFCSEVNNIEIEIVGAPEKAQFFYNNKRMEENPFEVKTEKKRIPIRVELNDRARMRFTVVPDKDMKIQYIPGGRRPQFITAAQAVPEPTNAHAPQKTAGPPKEVSARKEQKKPVTAQRDAPKKVTPKKRTTPTKKTAKKNTSAAGKGESSKSSGGKTRPFKRLRNELRKTFKN